MHILFQALISQLLFFVALLLSSSWPFSSVTVSRSSSKAGSWQWISDSYFPHWTPTLFFTHADTHIITDSTDQKQLVDLATAWPTEWWIQDFDFSYWACTCRTRQNFVNKMKMILVESQHQGKRLLEAYPSIHCLYFQPVQSDSSTSDPVLKVFFF